MKGDAACRTGLFSLAAAILLWPAPLAAQREGAGSETQITGFVKDADGHPAAEADVIAQPDGYRARTDSAGHFTISGLRAGRYTIRARKLGHAHGEPWTAEVASGSRISIELVLGRRVVAFDTVHVRADGTCSPRSLDGFSCRRSFGKGQFLDYIDIDDTGARQAAEIFRSLEGFRVELQPTRLGPEPVVVAAGGWRCIRSFVDGAPAGPANRLPYFAWEVIALEVYRRPSEVPTEYRHYSGNCSAVVYWTDRAPTMPRRSAPRGESSGGKP